MQPSNFNNIFANVSRETLERLEKFTVLLLKWNNAINLVGKTTADSIWERHITDSAQLFPLLQSHESVITDFGSGGGVSRNNIIDSWCQRGASC